MSLRHARRCSQDWSLMLTEGAEHGSRFQQCARTSIAFCAMCVYPLLRKARRTLCYVLLHVCPFLKFPHVLGTFSRVRVGIRSSSSCDASSAAPQLLRGRMRWALPSTFYREWWRVRRPRHAHAVRTGATQFPCRYKRFRGDVR